MSIHIIELSEKKNDWDSWSKNFLSHGKYKGCKKLLVITCNTPGVDNTSMQEEFESARERDEDLDNKIVKLGEVNELANEDLILLINTSSSVGKGAFGLIKYAKSEDFLEENCKVALDRLVSKYALHTASSLCNLKSELHNSKLELIDKDPDKWISHLEGL